MFKTPARCSWSRSSEFIRGRPPSLTDWARVFADADSDAPVAYNPDDDDELYDPNDDAAVEAFWLEAARDGRVTRGIGQDAVVLKPEDLGFDV